MKPVIDMNVRRAERKRCSISSTIRYFSKTVECRVVDVSETGIAIELREPIPAAAGSKVAIENEDFGHLEGIVKWIRGGRLGVEFFRDTNTVSKMAQYFRHFHQDYKPVITR